MCKAMANKDYRFILFQSSTQQMRMENILNDNGIAYKTMPILRSLSSECGTCIRISTDDEEEVEDLMLVYNVVYNGIEKVV